MYIVDNKSNKLTKVSKTTFKDNGYRERQHLQEWIAKEPSVFGEELLIIQKEFDEFDDTRERLDLLALDKDGCLVIIENKLDDSGRDVTWQAIKYASYCSSLAPNKIIEIYQDYLDDQGSNENAEKTIKDFITEHDLKKLNQGENTQRIFLVAAEFRKEVTSSVVWLRNYNIDICCFKVTPYKHNDEIFLDFDKIIPLPETAEYQMNVANKGRISESTKNRHGKRKAFWRDFIEYNSQNKGIFANNRVTDEHYLKKPIDTIRGAAVELIIKHDGCRVEVYFEGDKDTNKRNFDALRKEEAKLKQEIPGLIWDDQLNNKSRRIYLESDYRYTEESDRDLIFQYFLEKSQKLMEVFTEMGRALKLNQKI